MGKVESHLRTKNKRSGALNFSEIAKRKQASRDADEQTLASGEKSREDLQKENSVFAPLGEVKINLIGLKPLGKKKRN